MGIHVKFLLFPSFSFSGSQLRFYHIHISYPHRSFKYSLPAELICWFMHLRR